MQLTATLHLRRRAFLGRAAALWRALPGWRWLGRIVGARLVLPLAEGAYRAFLPLRPRLLPWLVAVGTLPPAPNIDLTWLRRSFHLFVGVEG